MSLQRARVLCHSGTLRIQVSNLVRVRNIITTTSMRDKPPECSEVMEHLLWTCCGRLASPHLQSRRPQHLPGSQYHVLFSPQRLFPGLSR